MSFLSCSRIPSLTSLGTAKVNNAPLFGLGSWFPEAIKNLNIHETGGI